MSWLWAAVVLVPLAITALMACGERGRAVAVILAPLAALPAVVVALWPTVPEPAHYDWLLIGTRLGVDVTGRIFLLLTSLVWLAAGLVARVYIRRDAPCRFFFFFLLTLTGNLGLVVAQDAISFYASFALMTFAAYGLVIHGRSAEAHRAGRTYLVMAVAGEAALLAGIALAVAAAGTTEIALVPEAVAGAPARGVIIGLLLAGLGIKLGAFPLHVWLPLAHPVAPTPASAVLSGAMIKAGLLGWLRFLPLGHEPLALWGAIVVAAAGIAAIGGIVVGLLQRDAKTALAYSSISQMGFVGVIVGAGLLRPESWPAGLMACLVYALHHGLIKAALFLGTAVARTAGHAGFAARLTFAGLAVCGVALAGAPLTTGALAKAALKASLGEASAPWALGLTIGATAAAVGTTLLMGRFLWLVATDSRSEAPDRGVGGLLVPWMALIVAGFAAVWATPRGFGLAIAPGLATTPSALWSGFWPFATGVLLLAVLYRYRTDFPWPHLPPGDLLAVVARLWSWWRAGAHLRDRFRSGDKGEAPSSRWYGLLPGSHPHDISTRLGGAFERFDVAGVLLVSLALVLFAVFLWGA